MIPKSTESKNKEAVPSLKGVLCSLPNILIYIIILFIFGMGQGKVIIVDLFENPDIVQRILNIVLLYFFLFFLSTMMTLYPTFMFNMFFQDNNAKNYYMEKWGLIYYSATKYGKTNHQAIQRKEALAPRLVNEEVFQKYGKSTNDYQVYRSVSFTRKITGLSVFVIWTWVVIKYYLGISGQRTWEYYTLLGFFFTGAYLSYIFFKRMIVFKDIIKSKTGEYKRYYMLFEKINKYTIAFAGVLFLLLILLVSFAGFGFTQILITMFLNFGLTIVIIFRRIMRRYIQSIGSIVDFLNQIRMMGLVSLFLIITTNICMPFATMLNPIIILLMGIITLYSTYIFLLKTYLFLKFGDKTSIKGLLWFKNALAAMVVVIFCANYYGNGLHKLNIVSNSPENKIQFQQFKQDVDQINKPLYYAAYGGGLKAHYWNLMVLNELEERDLFKDIICMSGVSGGAMGISSHTLLRYKKFEADKKELIKRKIASSNVLSSELSWLFGWDLIRENIPKIIPLSKDRSYQSMKYYAELFEDESLVASQSLDEVYSTLYKEGFYPNIIFNSTEKGDKYGVASAVRTSDMFPNAHNILDVNGNPDETLTFLEAVSTSNRFPIVSPAANIDKVGLFVDGGYYENSGIMSLLSFKKALDSETETPKQVKIISVRNSYNSYIEYLLKRNNIEDIRLVDNNDDFEISTIAKSLVNIERAPSYYKEMIETYYKDEFEIVSIDLPYYLTGKDINAYFGGDISQKDYNKIKGIVELSNRMIDSLLIANKDYNHSQWKTINPETARFLSLPVEIYIREMIKHPYVQDQIEKIKPTKN